jgi:hypothetical protein
MTTETDNQRLLLGLCLALRKYLSILAVNAQIQPLQERYTNLDNLQESFSEYVDEENLDDEHDNYADSITSHFEDEKDNLLEKICKRQQYVDDGLALFLPDEFKEDLDDEDSEEVDDEEKSQSES